MSKSGQPKPSGSGAPNGGDIVVVPIEYDIEDKEDQPEAAGRLGQIAAVPWDGQAKHLRKWVKKLEIRMETQGVGRQWTKRLVLEQALPPNISPSLDEFFDKRKTGAGNIYYDAKRLLLKLHGPRPDADFKVALSMVMTGAPSEAAKELVKRICKKSNPLQDCCCATAVGSLWRDLLPKDVRTAVANMDIQTDFQATIDYADEVWHSLQRPQVSAATLRARAAIAAVEPAAAAAADEPPAVAAVNQQRGRGRGRRRGRGQDGRGGGHRQGAPANASDETPPADCCKMHKIHKKNAYYCSKDPSEKPPCPWKLFVKPPFDQ